VIRAARLLEFRRRLSEAPASAAGSWSERSGVLLVLEDAEGHVGLGEASPLPGYSSDDLAAAAQTLRALDLRTPHLAAEAPASARAALAAALLDLDARQAGEPAWKRFVNGAPEPLALTQWLPAEPERALAVARRALERGLRSFKVKLEPGSSAGLTLLRALRREHGDRIGLNADANASLGPDELSALLPALRELSLNWLEEPTREPLTASIGIPLALDESLRTRPVDFARARALGVTTLVLKPTTLGGLGPALALARAATAYDIAAIASHTLEGPVGFMAAATLAFALGGQRPHGLGPHAGLVNTRPPALAGERDELVRWTAPGFGVDLDVALAGAELVSEERL
jgi:o-succinylbenzoate synthase